MKIKFTKRYKKIFLLNILITCLFFLTIFPNIIFAQQITLGFDYGFLPFQYSNSFTSIKNNTFYNAILSFSINLNQNLSLSFFFERNTYNFKQPNSFSLGFSYIKDFLTFEERFKVEVSDSFDNIFTYFENFTSILLDFYPLLFFFLSINNPIYIQPIFSSLVELPKSDTFEKYDINTEIGFYIYQLSIGLAFKYDSILYNFDTTSTSINYSKLNTYDLALIIKYVPTITAFGFVLALGYSYNDLKTVSSLTYIHQYIYAKANLIFTLDHFKLEPAFGVLIYSFYSDNITDISEISRLYLGMNLSYKF
jgi:hypothetical protein